MRQRSVRHATFAIERTYPAAPERVFRAWADPASKAKWFSGPEAWTKAPHALDFRVGGKETVAGGPKGGTVHRYNAVYQDIVPNERIVSTYEMFLDDTRISVSLATVEIAPASAGARLIYTEQAVFLDGYDGAESRERGTHELLDKLGAMLAN
ncbi:Putative glutathione S-transferase-related transmembrane protein [Minicystis rosea]|nr:Putative glutathione S-transferase-related transmembrane protein [Minicystis rosea]